MIPVLTRAQMRAFDKYAIESCHVPGVVLMENAGRGAADVLSAMIQERTDLAPRHPSSEALSARARAFPVRHVRSPGQPATYPLEARVVVV
ncbi:MAG TPA: bifunctional ADP-dependent NAD(P)H-hydrate dehydratase/NAD(P)H-hydrate epimerase, partial [Polyangium sp.]|nr:bifunctional ADP-dependent NAD(P)H-hydrate dehydratase/NAD(P)H-hydrate epimerase [Polyangium sp.]